MPNKILFLRTLSGPYSVERSIFNKYLFRQLNARHHCYFTKNHVFVQNKAKTNKTIMIAACYSKDKDDHSILAMEKRDTIPIQTTPNSGFLLNSVPAKNSQSIVRNKLNSIYQSYEELSHTNEIRQAHQHVERLQEELKLAQQRRREVAQQLCDIRYELQLCYADLANCNKGEPRYLEIIRREYEIHHKEKQKTEEFNLLDKAERDLFTHLQAAVKTSHEKEKIHTNSAKYWSIVGSLLGALLGICGTAFSLYNRNNMLTSMLSEVKAEFVLLREETKQIGLEVRQLADEQRKIIDYESKNQQLLKIVSDEKQESWIHWIGRNLYVISAYRYFRPRTEL